MSVISSPLPASSGALANASALLGAANTELAQDAQQIDNPDADPTGALLDLGQTEIMAQMGAALVHASDQMLGTLLDVFA